MMSPNTISNTALDFRRRLRQRLECELTAAGILLPLPVYRHFHAQMMQVGTRQWHDWLHTHPHKQRSWRPLAFHLDLKVQTIPRVLGFGALQTEALAKSFRTPHEHLARVVSLGALFNLGIVLFDWILDRSAEEALKLLQIVAQERLLRLLDGELDVFPPQSQPAFDFLLSVITHFCCHSGAQDLSLPTGQALRNVLEELYIAEAATAPPLSNANALSGEQIQAKSVLPIWAMALTCLHRHHPTLTHAQLDDIRQRTIPLGKLLWLIDDLVDVSEDWERRAMNQVWLQWEVKSAYAVCNTAHTTPPLQELFDTGVVDKTITNLISTWQEVNKLFPTIRGHHLLNVCLRATLQSWVYGLPA